MIVSVKRVEPMKQRFRKLGRFEKTKAGDKPLYADGQRGFKLLRGELGILAKDTGYFGVVRPIKKK